MRKVIIVLIISVVSGAFSVAQDLSNTDYKKALWMTTRFYGGQRSGDNNWLIYDHLPSGVNSNLRGKAFRADRDGSVDLSGGWHDCGDHVKFGQTQFYSAYMLLKGYEQFKAGYGDYYSADYAGYTSQSTSGSAPGWQWEGSAHDPNGIPDILDEIKHETDFLIKCTPNGSTFYYQIGDGGGNGDHATNNTAVKIQTFAVNQGGNNDNGAGSPSGPFRGAYKNPNDGAMASMCAAALALMSKQYEPFDPAYAALCLTHAENAYTYASNHIGQAAGTANGGFYSAHDNAYNPWAICLGEMFKATGQNSYKTTMNALSVGLTGSPQVKPNIFYSFDYANVGELALFVMAELGNSTARTAFNDHYSNHWINGSNYGGEGNYTGGGGWGQLRYTGNASFIVALYKKLNGLTTLNSKVFDNVDYILGSNNAKQSFVVGYAPTAVGGVTYAQHPHHRNAYLRDDNPSGGAMSATNIPNKNIQLGALVGGNKTNSASYDDTWTEFVNTEVCIDYNAGLVGGLAAINAQLDPVDTNIYLSQCASPGDLGGNQTLCGSGSIVLNSGLGTKSGRTFQWFRNEISQGSPSSSATTRTVTQAGTWKVVVDSSGACQRSSSVIITGTLPTVDLGADVELCDPSSTTFDAGVSGTGVNYAWTKDGNAYSNTQQINVSDAGTYAVTVSASGCPSQNDQVIVTSLLPEVNNDTICAAGAAASLQVTSPGGPFEWYANATGGSALQTGTTYTPTVSSNTTYYVVDAGSFSGNVGETTYLSGTQNWGVASGNHLNFDVLQDFSIEALKVSYGNVYSDQTGTITIEILDGSGNSFTPAKTFTSDGTAITTGMANSLIRFTFTGFDIKKSWGTSLRMRVSGHSNIGDLIWTQNGASYPYNSNPVGVVNITGTTGGNNDSNDYMYFYDWEVSSGVSCARRPVDVILAPGSPACSNACTPPASSAITPSSTQDICMGSNVLLTANSVSGYLYRWYRDGTPIAAAAINDNTLSVSQAGDYTVRIGDGDINDGACYLESSPVTVNVNSLPTATITTSALNYCEGVNGLTLDAANGGSGATYSWSGPVTGSGQSLSNATAGVYTVTVTRNGCDETSTSVTVVEDVSPTASISTSGTDLEYCAADGGVTLSATNAGAGATYSWSGPVTGSGINLSSATAGVYTVSVTRNGCNATSGSVTVVENTSPIASISTSGAGLIYCELSGGVTLSATDAGVGATYSWSGPVSGSGIDLSNATAGVYSVTVTKDGCNATSSNTTVVETPLPAAVITTTGLSYCAGNPGLTLDAQTVSGGAYSWSGPVTGSGASLSNATSGNYTVTVTANGCNATSSSVTVSEGAAPTASILTSGTDLEYCAADGGVTLSAADAGVGATYSWSGPVSGSGINLSNATAGVYTVTVSMNGCDAISGSVTVVENISPIASISTSGVDLEYCTTDGGVTLSATDAGVGATYSWSGPVTGSGISLSNATAGMYDVSVTLNGCNTMSTSVTVLENPLPIASITTTNLEYCTGVNGVTLDAQTVSGATYSWSGPVTGSGISLSNATAGVYDVLVTVNGCATTSSTVTVLENVLPVASITTTDLDYCQGTLGVTLDAQVIPGATYSWSGPVTGGGASLSNVTAGSYTVTVSENGCDAISPTVVVTETLLPTAQIMTSGAQLVYCSTGQNGVTLTAADAGIGATYTWSGPVTGSGISLSNATSGTYSVDVSLNGCMSTSSTADVVENCTVSCSAPTSVVIDQGASINVCDGDNVVLSATTVLNTATNQYYYTWMSGGIPLTTPSTTYQDLSLSPVTVANAGTIQLRVEDADGVTFDDPLCYVDGVINLTVNTIPTATITSTDFDYCTGDGGVTLDAQVVSGATYTWTGPVTGTGSSLSNATAGDYSVTVTANGCVSTSLLTTVTETTIPTAVITTTALEYCQGVSGVTLDAQVVSGATYSWSGPVTGTTQSLSNATSGTYTVTVDLNGCIATSILATVVENVSPIAQITTSGSQLEYCSTGQNGVTLDAIDAGIGATYSWSGPITGTGISLANATSGLYTVDVTLNGCTSTSSASAVLEVCAATCTAPTSVTIDQAGPVSLCEGETLTISGSAVTGTPVNQYYYTWYHDGNAVSTPSTTYQDFTLTSVSLPEAGSYVLRVEDADGVTFNNAACYQEAVLDITVNPLPVANITTTALDYCVGGAGVSLDAQTVIGATYLWSGPVTGSNQTLLNALAGSYTVTITDLNNCSDISSPVTVVENSLPTAQIATSGSQLVYCSTGQNGVTLDAIDAGIGATYSWSGPVTSSSISLANATSGSYTVDVTLNGCITTSASVMVTESCGTTCNPPASVIIDQLSPVTLCESNNLTLTGSAVTGAPLNQYYYTWYHDGVAVSTPSTSLQSLDLASVVLTDNGTYVLRVEDSDGIIFNNVACYQEANVDVIVNANPSASISTTTLDYCEGGTGVTLDAQVVAGATYIWSGPVSGSGQSLLNATEGAYTVTVDLNGCSSTSTSSNITTLPLPSHTGQITGAITACDNGVENYSIPTITNALSVDWTCVSGCGQVSLTPSGNDVSVSFGTESFVIEVSGNNACGASSSEQIAVNVQQTLPPSITIIPDNLQVCEGGTVTFTSSVSEAGNTPTYEWFRNGSSTGAATSSLIATGISNGDSFEATITSSDVCGAGLTSTSASVVITTGTVTGITTIDGPDQLCVKTDPIANFSVTNNTGSTYNWMVPDSVIILSGQGTSQVELDFNIENGGFIQVLEVSAGGCVGNTVGLNVINNCIDGFEDELFESHASLYPNPSSNDFHIEVMDGEEAVLRILDLNGIVLKEELVNTRELISFGEELEEGVYILQIIQEDQMLVRKITKLD